MQHQTVPQTTDEDRQLLAEISRWRKANGWTLSGQRGWVNARCSTDATLAVDYDEHRDGFTVARKGDRIGTWLLYPDFYPADSVRQAVDMLVALGILPDRFATSYRLGVAAGVDLAGLNGGRDDAKPAAVEHHHAAGWKGGPGECGVSCECGVTYDGFDSLGEASALLDRHIAEETKPAAPDYWLNLADDLRQAADRIATLTGTPKPKNGARLAFHCGLLDRDHETTRPVVDAIAAAFDATTKATPSGGSLRYDADGKVGELEVWAWAYIPAPDDAEKAAMRAELDALRAQLAEGGATR